DEGRAIDAVDLQNAVHARHNDEDATNGRNSTATETGTGTARYDRQVVFPGDSQSGGDLLRVIREDDDGRAAALDGRIVFEDDEVFGSAEHPVGRKGPFELPNGARWNRCRSCHSVIVTGGAI